MEDFSPGEVVEFLVTLESKLGHKVLKGSKGIVRGQQRKIVMVETKDGHQWLCWHQELKKVKNEI